MNDGHFIGAIDLGGTKILSLCLDPDLTIVGRDYRETEDEGGIEAVVGRMAASLLAAADGRPLTGVGISAPGLCDVERGIVTAAPNLAGWSNVPLARMISERAG